MRPGIIDLGEKSGEGHIALRCDGVQFIPERIFQ